MADGSRANVLRHLRQLIRARAAQDLTDGELLGQFIARRDEAAFALLVQRHGPMVLGACRRILRDEHHAEDAFQATFLVLVRKAASIRRRQSLGSWLYGVVQRVARKAKARASRRAARERQAGAPCQESPDEMARQELRGVLDEELGRLPEKYRAPLVLCYLEGRTQEQAARELNCPRSTLATRLDAGRALLRERLIRRDAAFSAGMRLPLLAGRATPASVPAALVLATVRAAATFVGGGATAAGAAAPSAVTLADAVCKGLSTGSLRAAGLVLLAMSLAVAGTALALRSGLPRTEPAAVRSEEESGQAGAVQAPGEKPPRNDADGDPLPPDALARMGTDRLWQAGTSDLLAFLDQDKALISADQNGTVHVLDSKTGKEVRRFNTSPPGVWNTAQALSPDQKLLAASSPADGVGLWEVASGTVLRRIKVPQTQTAGCLAFSPDAKILALASDKPTEITFWDTGTGQFLRRIQPGANPPTITQLDFSPDGRSIVAKTRDQVVHFWDATTGKEVYRFRTNDNCSPDYALAPDGKTVAVGERCVVGLWDLATGKELARLESESGSLSLVCAVAFSPDGKLLAVAGFRSVTLWDVAARKELHTLGDFEVRGAYLLRFSPDGRTLATAGRSSAIRLWDVATGRELHSCGGHTGRVREAAFSPDGQILATLGEDWTLRLWNTVTGRRTRVVAANGFRLLFTRDGKTVIVGDSWSKTVLFLNANDGKEVRRFAISMPQEPNETHCVEGLAASPSGKELTALVRTATYPDQGPPVHTALTLRWDFETSKQTFRRQEPAEPGVWALSPDGRLRVSYNRGPTSFLGDVKTGRPLLSLERKCEGVFAVAFSPDGRILAGVCNHGPTRPVTVALWELATGMEIRRFTPAPKGLEMALAFSPDGSVLAAGGDAAGGVQLWDLATGKELFQYRGYGAAVCCLKFSEDGRRLAGGMSNGTALVWDADPALRRRGAKAADLTSADLEPLWTDLGNFNAAAGQAAVWTLAARPRQALAFLKGRLRPAAPADARRVQQLLADLDSDRYAVREAAAKELEQQEQQAEALMHQALAGKVSAETRRRLEAILARPRKACAPETLRRLRAIQVLEAVGSAEARDLLRSLAGGPPAAWETQEAAVALQRLGGRPNP
jgi:RNA polymerase sigma factor (sigma-70 family)